MALLSIFCASLIATIVSVQYARDAGRARDELSDSLRTLQKRSYRLHIRSAYDAIRAGDAERAIENLDGASEERRGWEWHYLRSLTDRSLVQIADRRARFAIPLPGPERQLLLTGERRIALWKQSPRMEFVRARDLPGRIEVISLSSDARRVAVASRALAARVLDTQSLEVLLQLPVAKGDYDRALAFHPNLATRLARGSQRGRLEVRDIVTRRVIAEHESRRAIAQLAWRAPSGSLLANHDGGVLQSFEITKGRVRARILRQNFPLTRFLLAPDHGHLIGLSSATILSLDLATGRMRWREKNPGVRRQHALSWTPWPEVVAHANGTTLRLLDARSGRSLETLCGHRTLVHSIAVQGGRLFSVDEGSAPNTLRIWDRKARELSVTLEAPTRPTSIAIHPDGSFLASVHFATHDTVVRVWDLETERLATTLHGHSWSIGDVDWHPREPRLATCGADRSLRVWDLRTGEERSRWMHDEWTKLVRWCGDGRRLVTYDRQRRVHVWRDGKAEQLRAKRPWGDVFALACDAQGKYIVVTGRYVTTVYDAQTLEVVHEVALTKPNFTDARFDRNGRWLALCHARETYLYDTSNWELIHTWPRSLGKALCFDDSAERLICVGGPDAQVWDVSSGEELLVLPLGEQTHAVYAGGVLACSSVERGTRLWRRSSRAEIHERRLRAQARGPEADAWLDRHSKRGVIAAELFDEAEMDDELRRVTWMRALARTERARWRRAALESYAAVQGSPNSTPSQVRHTAFEVALFEDVDRALVAEARKKLGDDPYTQLHDIRLGVIDFDAPRADHAFYEALDALRYRARDDRENASSCCAKARARESKPGAGSPMSPAIALLLDEVEAWIAGN